MYLSPTNKSIPLDCFSCDADPAALAKYVVALVKKDKPVDELKDICVDQLEVFLSGGKVIITLKEKMDIFQCLFNSRHEKKHIHQNTSVTV